MRAGRGRRPERVAALVQETLAAAVSGQLKDPRVGFVTGTGVSGSRDCTHAHVRVSVLGDDDDQERAMEGLASAKGYLRTHLAKSLSLRVAPEIHFILDRGLEHSQRMTEILNDLIDEEDS
jgi:ribosome-binding factor A